MSIKSQIKYYSRILTIAVFVLGFNIGLTMVRPPEILPRKPASNADANSGPIVNDFEVSSLIDLGCGDGEKVINSETSLVRLKGCLGETGLPVEITNKTTGFTATPLDAGDYFTTDYFELSSGTNVISVTYLQENGAAKIYEYKVRVK